MALKIVKAAEPLNVESIVTVIYGDPGVGKTSLAFSAKNPILFDFDGGAHRAGGFRRGDTVRVGKWDEVANLTAQDLEGYDTIIVDTAGRMLEVVTEHICATDRKMGRPDGTLQLQGFGRLASIYKNWIGRLRLMGKDVILLAHAKEDKKGEQLIVRPDMVGSSKGELYKSADMMGYMTIDESTPGKPQKLLSFTPSPGWHAKDSGGMGDFILPDLLTQSDLMANMLIKSKQHMNSLTEDQQRLQKELDDYRGDCMAAETAQDLNDLKARLDAVHPFYGLMRKALSDAVGLAKVSYDKDQDCFVDNVEGAA